MVAGDERDGDGLILEAGRGNEEPVVARREPADLERAVGRGERRAVRVDEHDGGALDEVAGGGIADDAADGGGLRGERKRHEGAASEGEQSSEIQFHESRAG